jgi:hypothetical protein
MSIAKSLSRSFWISRRLPSVEVALSASVKVDPEMPDDLIAVKPPVAFDSWWSRDGVSDDGEVSDLLWNRGLHAGCHKGIFNVRFPATSSATLTVVFDGLAFGVDPFDLDSVELARLSRKFRLLSEDLIDDLLSEALEQGLFVAYEPSECAIRPKYLDDSTAIVRIRELDPEQMSLEEYVRQIRAIVAETDVPSLDALDNPPTDDTMPAP